jgi:hypothetical protein
VILLCGIPSEPPLRLVMEAADTAGAPYVLFNQRESQHADLYLEVDRGRPAGKLRVQETEWILEAFEGVYVRLMDHSQLPENRLAGRGPDDQALVQRSYLLHEALIDWFEMAECRVMNRMSATLSNASKPYQAQLIQQAGFLTPVTLVTNQPQEVREFLATHGHVIYKSISSERSIVTELGHVKLLELDKIRFLPTQFQAFVPGTNIRVHVVGDKLFGTEIQTEGIDYRYASQQGLQVSMAAIDLPDEVAERCVTLARLLGLPLCGIDLKRTPAGDYYCFEANPSPAYSYYQENTGQDIALAIVNYLQGKA